MLQKKSEKPVKKTDGAEQSEAMRRFKQHPLIFVGTIIVLVIVIIAFVLVPAIVPGEGIGASRLTFGYWDNKPVAYSSGGFFALMREQYSRYYQMNDYLAWRYAFEAAVVRTAALDTMAKSGYEPSKALVDKTVARLPQFQENGRFSVIRYNRLDAASRIKLWQDMRNDIIVDRYNSDEGAIKGSRQEAEFIGDMALVQRKFKMTAFPYDSFPDDEVAVYAGGNPDMFKTVSLSQITVSGGEREARAVLEKIRSAETTFEDAARTQSSDSYADRGGVSGARMVFEFLSQITDDEQRSAIINLGKDEVSDAVNMPSGWIIFRANEDARPADTQDSATLEKIRSYLMNNERGVVEDWLLEQAENFIQRARNNGFEVVAANMGIDLYEFGYIPVNYGDSTLFSTVGSFSAPGLAGASTDENFWQAAFGTPVGEPSGPIILSGGNGNIVVLYPEEEVLDDVSAAENSKNSFSGQGAEYVMRKINTAIMTSSKFKDDFITTYFSLLGN
ncbi:MAG: peptidylprolyl isomerase [Spirochaetaceae bacterium]|jgi:parvulin-like peptidyl-prolyl isomerase|nr:peptidylprolyl isomerase [Spirochaetaceae bacterium]